jgi:hypothetical protein
MSAHPTEKILSRMNKRDLEIAKRLMEAGWTDEDLYAALPTPHTESLLQKKPSQMRNSPKGITKGN